jgi:hypothetical protein
MPGTRNRPAQQPANARRRRAAHIERDGAVKARKRQRLARAEIHRAMERATELTRPRVVELHGPFKATDVKTPDGWEIVTTGYGDSSRVVKHAQSRDKARAEAKRLNDEGRNVAVRRPPTYASRAAALRSLGWELNDVRYRRGMPVEEKFVRVAA